MTSFATPPALRHRTSTAVAVLGWIAFAVLATADRWPHEPQAEPAAVAAAVAPTAAAAGPATPAFLDAEPEPLPPTF